MIDPGRLRTTLYLGHDAENVASSAMRVFVNLRDAVAWVEGAPRHRHVWLLTLRDGGSSHNPPFYTTTKLEFVPAVPAALKVVGEPMLTSAWSADNGMMTPSEREPTGYCNVPGSAGMTLHNRSENCVDFAPQPTTRKVDVDELPDDEGDDEGLVP